MEVLVIEICCMKLMTYQTDYSLYISIRNLYILSLILNLVITVILFSSSDFLMPSILYSQMVKRRKYYVYNYKTKNEIVIIRSEISSPDCKLSLPVILKWPFYGSFHLPLHKLHIIPLRKIDSSWFDYINMYFLRISNWG